MQDLINQFEFHSPEGIRKYFSDGVDPNSSFNGKPLFISMVEMYTRSPRFKDCIRVFADAGLLFDDKPLLAVLLDDAAALQLFAKAEPQIVSKRYSAFNAAYTPLKEVSLLHICAEYNHLACASVTVKGITWGKGYEWETLIPSVNPVSYAMMGLLPQMHRNETTVSKTVSLLLKHAYGIDYVIPNVPCAYLKK